jgi:hypothetical protein
MTFDEQGYPDDETLEVISKFNPFETPVSEIIAFLRDHWMYEDFGYFEWCEEHAKNPCVKTMFLHLHTGGWSGNESIITAMEKSAFWLLFWCRTERGGHYTFEVNFGGDTLR